MKYIKYPIILGFLVCLCGCKVVPYDKGAVMQGSAAGIYQGYQQHQMLNLHRQQIQQNFNMQFR